MASSGRMKSGPRIESYLHIVAHIGYYIASLTLGLAVCRL